MVAAVSFFLQDMTTADGDDSSSESEVCTVGVVWSEVCTVGVVWSEVCQWVWFGVLYASVSYCFNLC